MQAALRANCSKTTLVFHSLPAPTPFWSTSLRKPLSSLLSFLSASSEILSKSVRTQSLSHTNCLAPVQLLELGIELLGNKMR
jgi:hypothetical protein